MKYGYNYLQNPSCKYESTTEWDIDDILLWSSFKKNKRSSRLPCSWRYTFRCTSLATLSGQSSAEWKMDNNWVCFYLAGFKTTLWETVFIRTLLERVSPGWLTDWLWWSFIRPLHISLWTTHLQGLPLSPPSLISFLLPFLSCSVWPG